MHQTKLIHILKSFDKTEVKQFEDFLESPFFNRSEKALNFYRILIAYYPDFDSMKLKKEKVYKKLHGKSDYNDQMMKEITSALFKLAKEFIAHYQLKKKQFEAGIFRYEWMAERGLAKISRQELDQSNEILNRYEVRGNDYYYQRWAADYYEFSHQVLLMRDFEYKMKMEKGLDHHIHSLNRTYLVCFMESYIYLLSMAKIYNKEIDRSLASYIDTLAARYIGQGDQLIDIYYNVYQLHTTSAEQFYFDLKEIFLKNDPSIALQIKIEMSINLENYCIQKIREGEKRFGTEIMQIYRFEVEHDLMLVNGEIPYSFYQSVATLAMDRGEMEWAKNFVEKYRSKLPEQYRDETYGYCEAYILFIDQKYDEALRIMMQLNLSNNFMRIDIKNQIARIQYELGMFDQLEILLKSYSYHLNRETVSPKRKENHSLFATMMHDMAELKQQYNLSDWKKLSASIDLASAFTHQNWFVEKMADMKEKNETR